MSGVGGEAGKLPDAEDDKPPDMEVDEGDNSSEVVAVDMERDDEPPPPPPPPPLPKPMIGDIKAMPTHSRT